LTDEYLFTQLFYLLLPMSFMLLLRAT
jgi:hypothetical protein